MPTEIKRVPVSNITTGSYTALGTQSGRCTVTIANFDGINTRIAGHFDTQPANGNTVYAIIPSNNNVNYTFDCIPSKTWVIADSGGLYLQTIISW
jgi:hypothetical protein